MARNKELLMHVYFGQKPDKKCGTCCNFSRYRYKAKSYRKCLVYGDRRSVATDWNVSYMACGRWNVPFDGNESNCLVDVLRHRSRNKNTSDSLKLPGQLSFFEEE